MNKQLNYKNNKPTIVTFGVLFFIFFCFMACKKLIEIPPPVSSITSSQVFERNEQAVMAVSGIYYNLINSSQSFASYSMSAFAGMSADELKIFSQGFADRVDFERNNLRSSNSIILTNFWSKAYSTIYSANAIIEGLGKYSGVSDSIKNELIGEAKFVRAFCYFYLVGLFGDIPMITTTNWHNTNLINRATTSQVYENIINDLSDAENRLASDYSAGKAERIIPNKWAAKALLARVYLYNQNWANAETKSTEIINYSVQYSLLNNVDDIFKINNNEAIWQLKHNNDPTGGTNFNATPEGSIFIPRVLNSTFPPFAYITTDLLHAFEPNDQRFEKWIDSTRYNDIVYYFPYKYKIGIGEATANGPYSEYYVVLRLAEQYLIRAEARARQNKLTEAIDDLNIIRQRAGLGPLLDTLTLQQILDAVEQERRIELFAEWGNRWLDLKRWNRADAVLAPIKGANWQTTDQLYPIPQSELSVNPNLVQNPGY